MNNDIKYATLYKISLSLICNKITMVISPSDIVSISMIHNYDTMTFPAIRIRIYTDISVMQQIAEYPDDIVVCGTMDGSIYRMQQDDETSPQNTKPTSSICFNGLKAYIRQKNIATSTMDQYVHGIKRETDLNAQTKVPIELLCYDEHMIRNMRLQTHSIYKNVAPEYVLKFMLGLVNVPLKEMDIIENQEKYDQLIIPNMKTIDAFAYIDNFYGLYKKGGQLYCDLDGVYVTNTNVTNNKKPLPIHVRSANSNDEMSGLRMVANRYMMGIASTNISITSESDLQKVIQSNKITAININDFSATESNLSDVIYGASYLNWNEETIQHKSKNKFIADMYHARVKEKTTVISISGNGFDVSSMKINSRYNLIWESPQRGYDIDAIYRPIFTNHVFSNLDANLFIAETTLQLTTN